MNPADLGEVPSAVSVYSAATKCVPGCALVFPLRRCHCPEGNTQKMMPMVSPASAAFRSAKKRSTITLLLYLNTWTHTSREYFLFQQLYIFSPYICTQISTSSRLRLLLLCLKFLNRDKKFRRKVVLLLRLLLLLEVEIFELSCCSSV